MADSDSNSRLDSLSCESESENLDEVSSGDEFKSSGSTNSSRKKIVHAIAIGCMAYYENVLHKVPCHDRSSSGWSMLMSMLKGSDCRCHNNLRMHKEVFFMLCAQLVDNYGLKATRSVTVEEQVATFLMIVGPGEGNRQLQEFFQRSGYTISKSFHNVLRACTKMSIDWVRPFDDNSQVHPYIRDNPRYYPHFKDCIGSIDGTHIKAALPRHEQVPYIGRKGTPTQNIMAVCDFDLCFTFVLPGWEGSAHDTRIFYDTIRDRSKCFPMPTRGKYYLVDAGYPNITGFLAPYKGQKYHLPEFERAAFYNNHFEAFNHLHSSLRSNIERSFGVWKEKFHFLTDIPHHYPWPDQVALVSATMAIHNFIRKNDLEDPDFLRYAEDIPIDVDGDVGPERHGPEIDQNDDIMTKVRDDICTSITFGRLGISTQ